MTYIERIYYGLCETAFKERYTGITSVLLDMRKIEIKQNFPITSGH